MFEATIDRIENSDLLQRLGDRARPAASVVVGRGRRQDVLTGRWLGHPVHPAGVLVPLSCWFATALVDLTGGPPARPVARRLAGLGVLTALPAAASGTADWIDTSGAEQRVGSVHAIVNSVATALFAGSWVLRRRGRQVPAVALSTLAIGVAGAGGFLGGHLSYRRGVGVDTTAFQAGPGEWADPEIEGELDPGVVRAGSVGDVAMLAVHHDGEVRVLEDRCTHRGAPLHDGEVDGDCVVCPWHGSRFDLATGAVRKGPASAPQPVYETLVTNDRIQVRRAENGGLRRNPVTASDID